MFKDDIEELLDTGAGLAAIEGRLGDPEADVVVGGAEGGFAPFLLCALQRRLGRPFVVVTASLDRARMLHAALSSWVDGAGVVLLEPADVSPYQEIAPNRFATMERLAGLHRLREGQGVRLAVVPAAVLALRVPPPASLEAQRLEIVRGQTLDRDRFIERLVEAGYVRVPLVEDPGTFAVRGGILDVFSTLTPSPVRVDLFGDEVDQLRLFDPETQRSGAEVERVVLPAASEVPLSAEAVARARAGIRRLADDLGFRSSQLRAVLDDVASGSVGPSVLALTPAFHDHLVGLAEHLPSDALVVIDDGAAVHGRVDELRERFAIEHEAARRRERLVLPPELWTATPGDLAAVLERRPRLRLERVVVGAGDVVRVRPQSNRDVTAELEAARGQDQALAPLVRRFAAWRRSGLAIAVTCHTIGGAQRLQAMLRPYGVRASVVDRPLRLDDLASPDRRSPVQLHTGTVGEGFRSAALGVAVLDASEILGARVPATQRRPTADPAALISSFQELEPGDLVVHTDHGIGRYDGLQRLVIEGIPGDFLLLVYKDDHKLYLPVQRLDLVSRYVGGDGDAPPLDRLGGTSWERTKARVRKDVMAMAGELVRLYAARAAKSGHAFSPPDEAFRAFEATFPYEETPHQEKAIEDVLADMQAERPMDRLVCGDVGYGKTEVAVRAAFKAALDGKQAAVLVPTTVLAEQHLVTFEGRFRAHPVIVESLSRFKTAGEQRAVLDRVAKGQVDVVIGTHRLLQKDVRFRDLGLLVIDEEHRFGVKDKERIKQLRTQVDVLTLTATPIPRTLHMAMSGIRDLSIIATPPRDRLAIRTIVERDTDDVVRQAIERELARGGQVYLLHNRVESIGARAETVERLVPGARVAVAHGQMHKGALEKVMRRFVSGEVQVLVCTTIIESGLDIPNANTLIVDRADMLGLAELYQIRGRIGRGHQRAYAWLLIPEPSRLRPDAARRIAALQRCSELGAGFQIASHDLEIRGAGNLLGAEQHGQIDAVGYELYLEMLDEAVRSIRGEAPVVRIDTELRVPVPAYIPEAYCPDVGQRLAFYKRFAGARTSGEADEALREIADRCGRAPDEVVALAALTGLRLRARRLGLDKVDLTEAAIVLRPHPQGPIPTDALLAFVGRPGSRWRLLKDASGIARGVSPAEAGRPLDTVDQALGELANFAESRGVSV